MKITIKTIDAISALSTKQRDAEKHYLESLVKWQKEMKEYIEEMTKYLVEPDFDMEQANGSIHKPTPLAPIRPTIPSSLSRMMLKLQTSRDHFVELTDSEFELIYMPYVPHNGSLRIGGGTISAGSIMI